MKVRVGDLVTTGNGHWYKVATTTADKVIYDGYDGWDFLSMIEEVIRPAKPRRTLNRKQAREWLSGQEHWEVLETPQQFAVGCSTSPITCRQYAVGPTFTAAVIALRKKMGVK